MCRNHAPAAWAETKLSDAKYASELAAACKAVTLASKLCQVSCIRQRQRHPASPACDLQPEHAALRSPIFVLLLDQGLSLLPPVLLCSVDCLVRMI
jgi:hypothetical protein